MRPRLPVIGKHHMSALTIEKTQELFRLYLQGGYSVRELARISGISWTTLRDRFRRMYGNDYTCRSGGEGTIHGVVKEYLDSPLLTPEQNEEVKLWYERNLNDLLDQSYLDKKKQETKLYSDAKLERDSSFSISLREEIFSDILADDTYSPRIYHD